MVFQDISRSKLPGALVFLFLCVYTVGGEGGTVALVCLLTDKNVTPLCAGLMGKPLSVSIFPLVILNGWCLHSVLVFLR